MNVRHHSGNDLPLRGRRILLTRARGESNVLGRRLKDLGATVLELPMIAIEPPQDSRPLDAALQHLSLYDWIAFSSRNAVRAVVERLPGHEVPRAMPAPVRVAAVGESTAAELEAEGITVDCVPDRASGAALAESLAEQGISNARILLPVGNLARRDLPDGLRAAGAVVDEVEAYRTVAPQEMDFSLVAQLRDGAIDLVVFGSPSALTNLVQVLPSGPNPFGSVGVACMGPTTAAAARAVGVRHPLVANPSTLEGLIHVVVSSCTMEKHLEQS